MENHCANTVGTYNGKYGDGSKSYGGYSDYCRAPSHFVLKIPDAIPSEEAAPMLCGGITVFAPSKKNGCGPGKQIGIVGVGGLGHFGILYAKVKLPFHTKIVKRLIASGPRSRQCHRHKPVGCEEGGCEEDWSRQVYCNGR